MKIKTRELTGRALEWAVAKCEGDLAALNIQYHHNATHYPLISIFTKWARGGPIIEREHIAIWTTTGGLTWHSKKDGWGQFRAVDGPTPLIAAMRCYVTSKLGEETEVPKEIA